MRIYCTKLSHSCIIIVCCIRPVMRPVSTIHYWGEGGWSIMTMPTSVVDWLERTWQEGTRDSTTNPCSGKDWVGLLVQGEQRGSGWRRGWS